MSAEKERDKSKLFFGSGLPRDSLGEEGKTRSDVALRGMSYCRGWLIQFWEKTVRSGSLYQRGEQQWSLASGEAKQFSARLSRLVLSKEEDQIASDTSPLSPSRVTL